MSAPLQIDPALKAFVEDELLPRLDLTAEWFWNTLAALHERFDGRIRQLLARRDELQAQLDAWHREHGAGDPASLEAFLTEIGYLTPPASPKVQVDRVDPEIAHIPGPQLVVPATVARYVLNAANARCSSLYAALSRTAALPRDRELAPGYDEEPGAQVIAEADRLLDEFFPLAQGRHADATAYRVENGRLVVATGAGETGLADPAQFAGYRSRSADGVEAVLLRHNNLHVELTIDPEHRVGRQHHADVADVVVEAAVTTIVDLEDSVATVDGEDKALAYRTWLGLMTGELVSVFEKNGRTVERRVHGDREYTAPDGSPLTLPGRALLLVRNCGHHMFTVAVRVDGEPVAEGVLDALVSAVAALYDLRGL